MMARDWDVYGALASALTYPGAGFEAAIDESLGALDGVDEAARKGFECWAERMREMSPEEREEVYSRTFDLSPKCTLELGWHLFGESYDRGTFLVWMRDKLSGFSLEETTDLPDHVRHVLPVLGRLRLADADKFSRACVLPAMETIREGLKGMDSPYESLLDTICDWLESRHGASIRDTGSLPILSQHEELLRAEGI